jgi:carboxylate-amine ligase
LRQKLDRDWYGRREGPLSVESEVEWSAPNNLMMQPPFTIGVEEEFQIVDASTRELKSHARRVLPRAQAELRDDAGEGGAAMNELFESQVETGTPVCVTHEDVEREVRRLRRAVIEAAEAVGDRIVAASTHPFSLVRDQDVTPKDRYRDLAESFGILAQEHVICGCHVHVGCGTRDTGIAILNRARAVNYVLLALSGNSPFWEGTDTSYSSYRTEIWRRWPMAGAPLPFRDRAEYDALVADLIQSGAIADATNIYWDIRPADRFDTVEFRACDVGTSWQDTVAIALLCRAVAQTCWREHCDDEEAGRHLLPVRGEILRAAEWRAARFGLAGDLLDVASRTARPAREVVEQFLLWLRPSLEERGEWDFVDSWAVQVLAQGNGAALQRRALEDGGSLAAVVDDLAERTRDGVV